MIKPIKNRKDYQKALARVEALWGSPSGTAKGDELDVLMTLVEVYEQKHFPMPPSDPVEAILFQMERMHLERKDLEQYIGTKSRVSEVLAGKRSLSLKQIASLHHGLKIPYESLINQNHLG
jgi:HTH-type transcriptional regulator/antitoxin HigA